MFISLRVMAHEALRDYMASDRRAPMSRRLTARIYGVIQLAETCPGFSVALDNACADAFEGQTADGYGDLVGLFDDPPEGIAALLEKYLI